MKTDILTLLLLPLLLSAVGLSAVAASDNGSWISADGKKLSYNNYSWTKK